MDLMTFIPTNREEGPFSSILSPAFIAVDFLHWPF